MYYRFRQNNTGGFFEEKPPIASTMFIEADSQQDAIVRGQDIGLYWNGVEAGVDCECCGDRWDESPEEAQPIIDSEHILPTVESIAQYEADQCGCTASIVNKNDSVLLFIPDEEECKYTTLELCKESSDRPEDVKEVSDSEKPSFELPEGHVLVKDLKDGEGGELVTTEESLNGQAIFKKEDGIYVFHNKDFRKVPDASFRYWSGVSVKVNS